MNNKLLKRLAAAAMCAALALSMAACGASEPEPDPHEGMAYVNTGANWEWITPAEGVAVSSFTEEEFSTDAEGLPVYNGDKYDTRLGIDVSFYQGVIDWEAVAADGIEFAMIRCGYRGSETGEMVVDEQFENNIQGALDAGLDVGVYFFSQSTGAIEAAEECSTISPKIEVIMGIKKGALIIRIKNTFQHTLKRNKEGRLISTKKETVGHGYGIRSIEKTVENYQGDVIFEIQNNLFIITIIMNLPDF